MLISFGQKYFGQDTSAVPSQFLLWIIESYDQADWSLIQACKQELSARMKLDWEPPKPEVVELRKSLRVALEKCDHFENVIMLSTFCRGNPYSLLQYMNSREYTNCIIEQIKEYQSQTTFNS